MGAGSGQRPETVVFRKNNKFFFAEEMVVLQISAYFDDLGFFGHLVADKSIEWPEEQQAAEIQGNPAGHAGVRSRFSATHDGYVLGL
jgi:hypothetical protein